MSRRIEKQNVQGTGAPLGLSSTQCEYTDCVVFSNACSANFSQYSTMDWFSKSWVGRRRGDGELSVIDGEICDQEAPTS